MGRPPSKPKRFRDGFYIEVRHKGADTGMKIRYDTVAEMEQAAQMYSASKHVLILGEHKKDVWLEQQMVEDNAKEQKALEKKKIKMAAKLERQRLKKEKSELAKEAKRQKAELKKKKKEEAKAKKAAKKAAKAAKKPAKKTAVKKKGAKKPAAKKAKKSKKKK